MSRLEGELRSARAAEEAARGELAEAASAPGVTVAAAAAAATFAATRAGERLKDEISRVLVEASRAAAPSSASKNPDFALRGEASTIYPVDCGRLR